MSRKRMVLRYYYNRRWQCNRKLRKRSRRWFNKKAHRVALPIDIRGRRIDALWFDDIITHENLRETQ